MFDQSPGRHRNALEIRERALSQVEELIEILLKPAI